MLQNIIFIISRALRRLGVDFHERTNPAVQEMEEKINNLGSIQFKKDAIFTYFRISPHLANDELLKATNEPVTVRQNVWATR